MASRSGESEGVGGGAQGLVDAGDPAPPGVKSTRPIDDYLAVVRPVLDLIAKSLGDRCEVVLHDFRDPDRSIVEIVGNVTDRKPGGSVSQIGLAILAAGDDAEPQYSYVTRAPNGRVLKSSTLPLRDPDGHVFGALCINLDVTDLRLLARTLDDLAGSEMPPVPVTFDSDIGHVIADVINDEEVTLRQPLNRLDRQERLGLLRRLDARGVFSLQRAVPQVAEHLGISRATLYTDLREVREGT